MIWKITNTPNLYFKIIGCFDESAIRNINSMINEIKKCAVCKLELHILIKLPSIYLKWAHVIIKMILKFWMKIVRNIFVIQWLVVIHFGCLILTTDGATEYYVTIPHVLGIFAWILLSCLYLCWWKTSCLEFFKKQFFRPKFLDDIRLHFSRSLFLVFSDSEL